MQENEHALRCHFRGFLFFCAAAAASAGLVLPLVLASAVVDADGVAAADELPLASGDDVEGSLSGKSSQRYAEYVCLMNMSRPPSRWTWFSSDLGTRTR